jgi:hypothetical protein
MEPAVATAARTSIKDAAPAANPSTERLLCIIFPLFLSDSLSFMRT